MRWLVLAMLSALSLQWFVVASTPLLVGRLHHVALLGFTAVAFAYYRLRAHTPVLRVAMPFVLATVYMLTVWAVVEVYQGDLPLKPVQQFMYLGAFLAVGTFFYRAASGREPTAVGLLRWTAAACCVTVTLGLVISMLANGVNPLGVVQQSIAAADPEILQRELFRSSFTGFGYDEETVRGNIRHEVFGAVLLTMYVSGWAERFRPPTAPTHRAAYRASMIFAVVLLLVSLSRSILLAAALWPVIAFVRSTVTGRLTVTQIRLGFGGLAVIALAAASGFAAVLFNRFTTDTSSYENRGDALRAAVQGIRTHFLTGGVESIGFGESSHNFVLDAWLRGGVFVALPAAAVVVILVGLWITLLARVPREPGWMLPVTAALALPLVRLVTSGGGLINPVEWVALGFIAGVLAMRRESAARADARPALTVARA